jgi:hypothetical protein
MTDDQLRTYPVREDMRFQTVMWTLERVAWVLLALVPLAALAGIFSHGPLSHKTARAADSSLSLRYEHFQRMTVQTRFVIRMPSVQNEEVKLRLSPSFQRIYDIQSMQPEPLRSSAGADGLELYFSPASGGLAAVIWATPRDFGRFNFRAETDIGEPVEMPVLIYP